jgi:hypothetical protein
MPNNFLQNILRYPRFLVSSVSGLILVILTPFKNLLKTNQSRLVLISIISVILINLYIILVNMLAL